MRVLFACGGTAGHIYPAVAVARKFLEKHPETQVLFVGAEGGMETGLIPREGFPFQSVTITGFSRRLKPSHILFNLKTLRNLRVSHRQADAILESFWPDLVIGTGGYASYPVLRRAAARGIPTAVHESNAVPGLTTRTLARVADRVMVSFEDSRALYPFPERVLVTGTPVRDEFFSQSRAEARARLKLADGKPLVLSYWGSLGARDMNRQMEEFFRLESEGGAFYHIHAAGGQGYAALPGRLKEAGVDLSRCPWMDLREYIYDMPLTMAAADLVICRAGASTLAELTALAKPCILVPSPNVTGNHQERNARVLESRGGAVVICESDSSGARLYETTLALLRDPDRLKAMREAQSALSVPDAAERIYAAARELVQAKH